MSVSRNGIKKQHIVLGWPVAQGLLSDRPDAQRASIHTMAKMLVSASLSERHVLQDSEGTCPAGPFTHILHRAISTVPSQYYISRATASVDTEASARYAAFIKGYVPDIMVALQQAHVRYQASEDVNELLETALSYVGPLIEHVAQWCGHVDGHKKSSGDPHSSGATAGGHEPIQAALAPLQLGRWSSLLHGDLRTLFEVPENFTTEGVYALTSHLERALWSVGIHPWPMDDGQMYVTVGAPPCPP